MVSFLAVSSSMTFSELAAVLGARDHAGQVERDQALALQGLWYVAGNNLLGQTLDNGGLAETRITDQRRVVLGAAGQDLDDTKPW